MNKKGDIIFINKAGNEILGYEHGELIGKNWFEFCIPKEKRADLLKAHRAFIKGTLESYEFRKNPIITKNGKKKVISWHNTLNYDNDRNVIGTLRSGEDITELIKIKDELEQKVEDRTKKLKKSEQEKLLILKSISELIAFQDLNNTIIWVNQAAGDSLGMHPDELVGKKCHKLWHRSNEVCENCPVKISIKTGLTQSGEIISPDGRIWSVKGFPVKDETGNVIGVVEVSFEITELKEAEKKVGEAYKRMNLYRNLFAHDINNIFSNIKLASELCRPYLHDLNKLDELRKLHQVMEEQIIRGNKLIRNVQTLTLLEESKFLIKQENLSQVLNDSIKFLQSSYPNRNIDITTDVFKDNIFVKANELLVDVFENILFNAVIHNENPRVEINVIISKSELYSKRFIKLEFKDNGIGISDERKQAIFQREKEIDRNERGLGLGLSLTKKIIDGYDGKMWIEDRINGNYKKGSNFILLIPET